ncbi:bifunctional diguanylate cyclase/phosphodiesterase [Aquincola tertiaricarbonis]|uniref:bifunctional diguanylate cyclase/phosphodiesterase n=1 Tax=Aquincola tertiaricarbonis TaxID=391953 RepID=UPI0006153776|nr:diguanylate cyclase [Aquincola tertiaricarbonis]
MFSFSATDLVEGVGARRRRLKRGLIVANVVVALLLGALVVTVLTSARRGYEHRALTAAEGRAAVAQLNLASELGVVDAVMQATVQDVVHMATHDEHDVPTVDALLRSRGALLKDIESMRLADDQGRVRGGFPAQPDISVVDRDYFALAQQHLADKALVAGPFKSRTTGNWVLALVHPLRIHGRFAGALYGTINVDHFADVFDRYDLQAGDAVALRTADLRLIARRAPGGGPQGAPGSASVSPELMAAVSSHPVSGNFASVVAIDGATRITAYRAVEGWPLLVFAGVNQANFLAPWNEQAWHVTSLAGLAWVLIAIASGGIYKFGAREAQAMQTIAANAEAQRQAQAKISQLLQEQSAMLNNDVVGMMKLDAQQHIGWRNRALELLLGYPAGELAGQPLSALFLDRSQATEVMTLANALLASGENCRVQVQLRRKASDGVWADLNGVRVSEHESFWIAVDATAAHAAHDRLRHAASHDALTLLPNRVLLLERLSDHLANARRAGDQVGVCYLDLDGFKAVNDQHGHGAGDALLVEVARRMVTQLRTDDTVARMGGDEFVVLLAPSPWFNWPTVLARMTAVINAPVTLANGHVVTVGVSMGLAASDGSSDTPAALLTRADQAMLEAKRQGKGRLQIDGGLRSLLAQAGRNESS